MKTIKSSEEISAILKQGTFFKAPYFFLIVHGSQHIGCTQARVAYIAGKKNGNAVWRNAAKRRLRSLLKDSLSQSDYLVRNFTLDMIIMARKPLLTASYQTTLDAFENVLTRIVAAKDGKQKGVHVPQTSK